jgi:magnesium-transporting ATPase (P-type)
VLEGLEGLEVARDKGLGEAEVRRRRGQYGPNRLRKRQKATVWKLIFAQFSSIIVLLLAVASAVSFAFGDVIEGLAIGAVIFINAAIGFVTEWRAVRSMEALRQLSRVSAKVRRDGEARNISAEDLVPGDIVLLEGGDIVAADLRLLEASKLQLNESALTGESAPSSKSIQPVEADADISDRTCMLFKGTTVTRGSGEGVVVATGMGSQLGEISALVEDAEQEITPLEKRLDRLGRKLVWVTLGIVALMAVSVVLAGKEPALMIQTAIALAVAAIPEGLPIVATMALARGMWRMARRNVLINRLSAVETLGATGIICTDKTGTLTENRLTVVRYALDGADLQVGSPSEGETSVFICEGSVRDPAEDSALQILFLNPVTDVFPALALGMGDGDSQVMDRRPRDPGEPVLTMGHWRAIAGYGVLIAITVLAAFWIALDVLQMDADHAVTVSFLVLAFAQLWHVFNLRGAGTTLLANDVVRNLYVWGALGLCVLLLLAAVYMPGLSSVLRPTHPGAMGWLVVIGLSVVPLLVGQAIHMAQDMSRPEQR